MRQTRPAKQLPSALASLAIASFMQLPLNPVATPLPYVNFTPVANPVVADLSLDPSLNLSTCSFDSGFLNTSAALVTATNSPTEPAPTKLQIHPSPSPTPTLTPDPTPNPTPAPTPDPTPNPTPAPNVSSPADLEPHFATYAQAFNVDANLLKHIANCESHFNPGANNGPYGGMFQYSSSTWQSTRTAMGLDPNPELRFHAEESIKTTAFKIASGGQRAWANCLPH